MSLIDFGIMRPIFSKYFDRDRIDIGRKATITTEDGWEEETDPRTPIYLDVPCHIEPISMDNPDVGNTPTKPVITSFKIFLPPLTDIKNGDYITMKFCDTDGNVLQIETGISGEPHQYASRLEISVGVMKWT